MGKSGERSSRARAWTSGEEREKEGAEDGWLRDSVDGQVDESTGLLVRMRSGNERG